MKSLLKVLIDSSVIIESLKGNEKAERILRELIRSEEKVVLYLNPFVFNEVIFISLLYFSNLSAKTLRKKKELIKEIMKEKISPNITSFLNRFFILLSFDSFQNSLMESYIEEYGLLPTDASVLATCKHYGIKYLISIDREDFTVPREKEGIVLIDSVEKLKEVLNK